MGSSLSLNVVVRVGIVLAYQLIILCRGIEDNYPGLSGVCNSELGRRSTARC